MPVAVFLIVIETPGMTAFCASVTMPWSVPVDCAPTEAPAARIAPKTRVARSRCRNATRLIIQPPVRLHGLQFFKTHGTAVVSGGLYGTGMRRRAGKQRIIRQPRAAIQKLIFQPISARYASNRNFLR